MNKNRNSAKVGLKKKTTSNARLISNNLENGVHGQFFYFYRQVLDRVHGHFFNNEK